LFREHDLCAGFSKGYAMNQLSIQNSAITMTSREIAELTGKELSNVHRDIRSMITELLRDDSLLNHPKEDVDARGYTTCFYLDRELTETLLTGYSVSARLKVIRRWHELEAKPSHNIPTTLSAALRLAADQSEQIEAQQAQLAIAAPKVEFVDRYVESTGLRGFREVCKLLGANESQFREFLIQAKIMYRLGGVLMPMAAHMDAGRFVVKTGTSDDGHAFNSAKFTTKGVEWVAGLWAVHGLRESS
jgi:phage antirepressor YoqD-like protein